MTGHPVRGPAVAVIGVCAVILCVAGDAAHADAAAPTALRGPHPAVSPSHAPVASPAPMAYRTPAPTTSPSRSPNRSRPSSPSPTSNQPSPRSPRQLKCGPLDVACRAVKAINDWFAGLVSSGLGLALPLVSRSLLHTPDVAADARVHDLWRTSAWVANTCYVLFVVAGGLIVLTGYGAGSRYALGQIVPRLVIGVVASNLSLEIVGQAIPFANALSAALLGSGFDDASLFATVRHSVTGSEIVGVLLGLVVVVLAFVVAGTFIVRLMVTTLLTAAAPLFLACHGLPQTERFAVWWWRAMAGCLLIQAAQALVLAAAVRVWFTGTGLFPAGTGPGRDLLDVLLVICLLYVAARVPFWVFRLVTRHGIGTSPIAGAARFVLYSTLLGRVSRALRGARPSMSRPGGGRPPGRPGGGAGPPKPTGPTTPGPRRGWTQPALPLSWPSPGVAGLMAPRPHGGQRALPFPVPPEHGPPVAVRAATGDETELPFRRPPSRGWTQLRIPRGVAWEQTAFPIRPGPRPVQDELPFPPTPRYVQGELPLGTSTQGPRYRRRAPHRPTLGELHPELRTRPRLPSSAPPAPHPIPPAPPIPEAPPPRRPEPSPRRAPRGGRSPHRRRGEDS